MANKKGKPDLDRQISLFELLGIAQNIPGDYSSEEIESVIDRLREVKRRAKKREEDERKQKEREEQLRREREEKERREAHIQKVTCMDLPLDWSNIFNSDC